MSPTPEPPPVHVRAAFGARDSEPELIDGGPVWRCGDAALRPATNPAQAAWVGQTLDALQVDNLRVARPLRSTDGRWVVGGWAATRVIAGRAEPRHDEVVSVAVRLHQATAGLTRPRFIDARADVFAVADRVAFAEEEVPLDADLGGRLFEVLAGSRRPMASKPQVVHGDLFGNVLFAGSASPAIMDFEPYWRPAEWAAAVIVVDALAWGGADEAIVRRWSHLPDWPQALLRALLFRLAVHALHPYSTTRSLRGLERVAHQITELH
ncbi:MAG TPA: TIGR02569 family protein [Pseudonocardiaceae bacterium]|nr:TIGR02569 family protein [Pseudonocardiaceae bacterium]